MDKTIKDYLVYVAEQTQSKEKVRQVAIACGCYGTDFLVNYIWNIAKDYGLIGGEE